MFNEENSQDMEESVLMYTKQKICSKCLNDVKIELGDGVFACNLAMCTAIKLQPVIVLEMH